MKMTTTLPQPSLRNPPSSSKNPPAMSRSISRCVWYSCGRGHAAGRVYRCQGLRSWPVEGLRRLETPETRKVLWKEGYRVATKIGG